MRHKTRWIIESVYFYCGRHAAIEAGYARHAPVQEQEGWSKGDGTIVWEKPETIWSPEQEVTV